MFNYRTVRVLLWLMLHCRKYTFSSGVYYLISDINYDEYFLFLVDTMQRLIQCDLNRYVDVNVISQLSPDLQQLTKLSSL